MPKFLKDKGMCVLCLGLLMVASSIVLAEIVCKDNGSDGIDSGKTFDHDMCEYYIKNGFLTDTDLLDDFNYAQTQWLRLVPPGMEIFTQPVGIRYFEPEGFPAEFVEGLLPVEIEGGAVVYPVIVREEPGTRNRIFLNIKGEEISVADPPKDYDWWWFMLEQHSGTDDKNWSMDGMCDPSHLDLRYDLILKDDLIKYVMYLSLLPPAGGEMLLDWEGGSVTNLQFVEIAPADTTNGTMNMTLAYPDDFTNRISLIACTNLIDPVWSLLLVTNPPASTNAFTYADTDATNYPARFYYAYNAGVDSDGDGLSDGAELFVLGSDSDNSDTDGDGMGDAAEVAHGFNPNVSNAYHTVLYTETFESRTNGVLNGQDGWYCAPTNAVAVQTNVVYGGSNAAEFVTSTNVPSADQYIAAHGATNVWIDFRAKVDPRAVTYFDDHPDIANAPPYEPSVFAINRRGEVWAHDGAAGTWTNDSRFVLMESQWHRFTIKQSYSNHTWDLFVDSIRVFTGLGMRQWANLYDDNSVSITEFSCFTVAGARGGGWYVDNISITNQQPSGLYGELQTVDKIVAANSDDAEENIVTHIVDKDSDDLDLGFNDADTQIVGIRFASLGITNGAAIWASHIQFTEASAGLKQEVCNVLIEGQNADNALTFTETTSNISVRTRTTQTVGWSLSGWFQTGQASHRQRTPAVSSIVHAVVTRGGWQANNGLVFIISSVDTDGNQQRETLEYTGTSNKGPVLHVEWAAPLP